MPFVYTSGNPDNLVGGATARMSDIQGPLYDIRAYLNALGGVSGGGGSSIIGATELTTSAAYTTLTTPDQVSGLIVPNGAEVEVSYMALWQRSLSAADARAAIFCGVNQLQRGGTISASGYQEAQMASANTNLVDQLLSSGGGGLFSTDNISGGGPSILPTTGMIVGGGDHTFNQGDTNPRFGVCRFFVAAGTYDISVRFKVSSGQLMVKQRQLRVRVLPF